MLGGPAQETLDIRGNTSILDDPAGLKRQSNLNDKELYHELKTEAEEENKTKEWQSALLSMCDKLSVEAEALAGDNKSTKKAVAKLSGELSIYVCAGLFKIVCITLFFSDVLFCRFRKHT